MVRDWLKTPVAGADRTRRRSVADVIATPPEEIPARTDLRLRIIGGVAIALLAILTLRLWSLQVVNQKSYTRAVNANVTRTVAVAANRGVIADRTNTILVGNVVHYDVTLSLVDATADPTLCARLGALLNLPASKVLALAKNPSYLPYQPAPIATDASAVVVQYLAEHRSDFPGVAVSSFLNRSYPNGGTLGSDILGWVGQINGQELAQSPNVGYLPTSQVGKAGVEQEYEQFLRGASGKDILLVDSSGSVIGTTHDVAPKSGDTVVLNIDANLQHHVEQLLHDQILQDRASVDPRSHQHPRATSGAVVVMDPRTGAVLALASYPNYNLNEWVGGISTKNYKNLLASGALNNYALSGLYTPGSTFKLISATAALNDKLLNPSSYYNDKGTFTVPKCTGKQAGCTFHDDETAGTGLVNLPLAIIRSSDVYFYNIGYLFWSEQGRYGTEPIQKVGAAYGLDSQTGIDMPTEAYSRIDSPSIRNAEHLKYPKAFPFDSWYTGDNVEMAFGQGGTVVTPMALANAYATFANGGTRYAPEVAAAVVRPDGSVAVRYAPRAIGTVPLPSSTRDPILQGLIGVVNNPTGTAYATFKQFATFSPRQLLVAGKTGTASNQKGQEPNSWFASFAPAYNPKYVVLAVIAEGGYGASAAAPVVAKVYNYLAAHPISSVVLPSAGHPPVAPKPLH